MNPVTVNQKKFHALMVSRSQRLLGVANYFSKYESVEKVLIRPVLGQMISQSTQLEELLDAYGARNNSCWYKFRSMMAAIKLFSDVSYELLHIQHALPAYRLLPIKQDFVKATQQTLNFTGDVLSRASAKMLTQAHKLELPIPQEPPEGGVYSEQLPPGRLSNDRTTRKIETVSETVTMLATAFLNLAAESKLLRLQSSAFQPENEQEIAEVFTEEQLRGLELRFHNLQSLYDTYVSETETEVLDENLPILRGHISVVFHLLRTATMFAHYYERHVSSRLADIPAAEQRLVEPTSLLTVLLDYSVNFASQYLGCAQRLCQQMLKLYAEVDRIETPVPQYRGFHVRPATLISKLVLHYGSEVKMQMDDEQYDAGSPLELFRANEKINAHKRRWLAKQIVNLKLIYHGTDTADIKQSVRSVVLVLAESGKLILYEQPLQLSAEVDQREGTLLEQVTSELAHMLATGKIDIHTDLNVTFIGDKRVLKDIILLAESGYGEDNFGNNVPLPDRLAYLRR